jgi:hypothetical protein
MWPTFAADRALTSAIVDVTRGLRADLTRSVFHLKNVAASSFQQGTSVEEYELLLASSNVPSSHESI